jgi:uncharacterized protein
MTPAAHVAVGAVRIYQWTVRPVIGANCRFLPSCSDYAIDAFRAHGALRGSGLAARRILRCHPWNGGGYDPVPACDCAKAPMHLDSSPSPSGRGPGGGVTRHDGSPATYAATSTRPGATPPPGPLPQGQGENRADHCRAGA